MNYFAGCRGNKVTDIVREVFTMIKKATHISQSNLKVHTIVPQGLIQGKSAS